MNEHQNEGLARLQKSLNPYIRSRQEVSHIRRVLALHLRQAHQQESDKDGSSRPFPLQELNEDVKSSSSRGLRKDYIKSLRANSKARQEYANITSEHLDHNYAPSVSKKHTGAANKGLENPLDGYVLLLQQQQRLEKLQVVTSYVDLLDQKPAASPTFLDYKSISEGIEPLPPVPSAVLNDERIIDGGSSTNSIPELTHQLEKAVLQAKGYLDSEKRQTMECKSRLAERQTRSRRNVKQRLEALGRTRNDMISWMEEQLGKTGDGSSDDDSETRQPQRRTSTEGQLIHIQKEYRKYVIARQELLTALRTQTDGFESAQHDEAVEKLQIPRDTPETTDPTDLIHPYLTELLSISNEQKSQILQRSYLNTCLAKQQKENMQSMDRLAEESHLLPMYSMRAPKPNRSAGRSDPLGGMLIGSERPDFIGRARGWVFAADAAGKATRDGVLERVEEGRAAIDESLHTLLGLHQLLGYDLEDANEEDIWAPDSKSPKRRNNLVGKDEREEDSRRDIWSRLDGNLGVIRREDE